MINNTDTGIILGNIYRDITQQRIVICLVQKPLP